MNKIQNIKSLKFKFLYLFFIGIFWIISNSIAFCAEQNFPTSIIKLPENENAILVEKKTQTLFLYSAIGSDPVVQFKATISTGESPGIKQKAGDKKTPEGIYFLKDEYEDKYLSPIYGKKAFPTDYPNFIDKREGKNGSAIWIHGTNKKLIPLDSNGCVALENSNILKLSNYVNIDSTPVIMMEELDKTDKVQVTKQRQEIIGFLSKWMQTIETGSYHEYLSFYSSQYVPDISWWEDWNKIRKKTNELDAPLKVKGEKIGIYYHDSIFVVLFEGILIFKDEKVVLGKRKLFLEKKKDDYKIIGDIFQTIPEKLQQETTPLIAAAKIYVKPVSKKEYVVDTINQWLLAWSAKDMDMYASFYTSDFHSDGLNKKSWVKRKRSLAKKYDFINVTGSNFKVEQKNQTCEVLFFQKYESSGLTTQGTKRLILVNKGGLWKISQESWKEK